MVWGAVIGAAASLAGGAMQQSAQTGASTDQRHFAREMFDKQKKLMNTAHQREVKDLRKAGLNPILSAKTSGAGTPGALGYQPPQFRNIGAEAVQAGAAAHTAQSVHRMQQSQASVNDEQIAQVRASVEQTKAQTGKTKADTRVATEMITNMRLEAERIAAEADRIINSGKLLRSQTHGQNLLNDEREIMNELYNKSNLFKYLKEYGPKGAAMAQTFDVINETMKKDFSPRRNKTSAKSQNRRDRQRRNRYQ